MSAATSVFHLVYYGYEKTVVDSQVVTPALRLLSEGIEVTPVFLEDPLPWAMNRWHKKAASLEKLGLNSRFLPRAPRNVLGLNTFQVKRVLSARLNSKNPVVVHARGFQGAQALLPIKREYPNLRVICDARGIESEEFELDIRTRHARPMNAAEAGWKARLETIAAQAVRESDVTFCVSRSMIAYLQKKTGVAQPFEYVPCGVDVSHFAEAAAMRESIRREVGVSDRLVLVYSGSLSAWQIPDQMLRVASRFLALHPEAIFLALTPEPARMKALAEAAGMAADRVRSLNVSHDHVRFYLAASDAALLLREDNDVNRHACPTKFAEYLAAGLHVIATPAVSEVAETLRAVPVGTLLDSLEPGEPLDRALKNAAASAKKLEARTGSALEAARDRYDWRGHLPTLKKWYLQLSSAR